MSLKLSMILHQKFFITILQINTIRKNYVIIKHKAIGDYMRMIYEKTLEEIKNGYTKDKHNFYHCHFCDACFEDGEIFPIHQHFYRAEKAMQMHIREKHGSVFKQLMQLDKKLCSLTEVQKKLMRYMLEGKTDKEIALLTNTSASTVRHQRFVFKEKARQAKMYLALYELAIEGQMEEFLEDHEEMKLKDLEYIDEEQEVETIE